MLQKKSNGVHQCKSEWNACTAKLYDSIDFENLTGVISKGEQKFLEI